MKDGSMNFTSDSVQISTIWLRVNILLIFRSKISYLPVATQYRYPGHSPPQFDLSAGFILYSLSSTMSAVLTISKQNIPS